MIWFGSILVVMIIFYLIRNGSRNSDPLNRKCAAEICQLITSKQNVEHEDFVQVFMNNARYQKQANHIVSMVPSLLIKAGYPEEFSMSVVPVLRQSAMLLPK